MNEKIVGMSAEKAKRLEKPARMPRVGRVSKSEQEAARKKADKAKQAFVEEQTRKVQELVKRGIDPSKRVHIVTTDKRVLFLVRFNPKTGIATCRTTRNVTGVKFDDILRLATPEEIPRLSKQFCFFR